jgi:dipeptide transport system permease protein
MLRFIFTKLALLIPTFIGVTLLTFFMIRAIPGDPIELLVGERGIAPERHAMLRAQLGLDRPLPVQYAIYIGDVLQGDLGRSIVTKKPVLQEFLTLFPATLELAICAMIFAVAVGLPLGILAGVRRGRFADYFAMGTSLTGYSMPIFWWGLLLIILFSVNLHWTPVNGRIDLVRYYFDSTTGLMLIDSLLSDQAGAFWNAAHHLILPTVVLGTVPLAIIARMTRSSMLEVLSEDYVRTARAKGLAPLRIVSVHALRNALIPVVTVIGLQVGTLMGGAILTETIFAWPGIGKWLVDSVGRRDFPAVQGGVLLVAMIIMIVNLTVDLLYGLINPRIRHARR